MTKNFESTLLSFVFVVPKDINVFIFLSDDSNPIMLKILNVNKNFIVKANICVSIINSQILVKKNKKN
jgi:hypothetical protein